METRWIPIVMAVLYFLVIALCAFEHSRRKSRENGVYLPGFFLWVGIVCGGVFAVLGFLAAGSDLFTEIGFAAFVVLSLLLMLGWCNCFLIYDDDGFTQQNLIGMRRRFRYEQVTGWDVHPGNHLEATVYVLGKKVTFSMLSAKSVGFMAALTKGYRRTHGGKSIPAHWKPKNSTGFCAHVRNPGEFLFVFVLMLVFLVGMGIWCGWMIWTPIDGSDCETLSVTFTDWVVKDGDLKLTAQGYETYFEIRGYPEFVPLPEALVEHCDGETVFEAQARRVNPDDGPDYYWIQALRADGMDYLTFADTTAYNRTSLSVLLWIFGGFLVLLFALAGLMYLVGSNPAKYPKWLVNGLFKEGYIVY